MPRKKKAKQRGVFEKETGSGVWWVQYFDTEGKRRREKVGRKSDAIKLRDSRKADATAGRKIKRPLRETERTFKQCAALALEYSRAHKSNVVDDEQKIAILVKQFGDRKAASITQAEITLFLDGRDKSAATFNRYKATFSMIYREAIRHGWLSDNPARLVKAKREPVGRIRFLSDDEESSLGKIISEWFPDFRPEFDLALHTGMRLSEQFGLTWTQVDFERAQLHLLKTKNGSPRTIPLNSVALSALSELQFKTQESGYVFLNSLNRPFRKSPIRRWFQLALQEAKLEDVTWHTMRHTFCSRLIMAGVDLKTAQELMGHKTIAMTARYAHLSPGHLHSAVQRLVRK